MDKTQELAEKILVRGIESFISRRNIPVFIPSYEIEAEVGFSPEYISEKFNGFDTILNAIKKGRISGIVNMVGCCNPRVIYEKAIVDITEKLLANNVLILTNGCASFSLLKLGFCNTEAQSKCGSGLKDFLPHDIPPVWHMGECIDNTKCSEIFSSIANCAKLPVKDMPYAFASPEWSNEKGLGASFAFRLQGINSYHCVYPSVHGSANVMNYIMNSEERLGSTMNVDTNPDLLADEILNDLKNKRAAFGWDK